MGILEKRKSSLNGEIEVKKSLGLGTYIQVDSLTQSGGVIISVWRTALSRVVKKKTNIGKVLILGLGGGSVAKLARDFWPKAEILGVEIDPVMVDLGKKYLGLGEANVEVKVTDAYSFVAHSRQKFDLVLIDTYHGYEFPKKFEKKEFLRNIQKLMSKTGLIVFNRLYFDHHRSLAVKFGEKLEKTFLKVEVIYPEANIIFLCSN